MTTETYNPEKPPWDTRIEGEHPAFAEPMATDEEIAFFRKQARALATSHGRSQAGEMQTFLSDQEDRAHHHRINLEWALQNKQPADVVLVHRRSLALALLYQGEFVRALNVVRQGKRTYPGCRDLVKQITAWRRAVYRPDGDVCGCEREHAMIPDLTRRDAPDVEIELPRRNMLGWVFSPKHAKVVEVWECRCGFLNAHDQGPPSEQQQRIRTARIEKSDLPDTNLLKPTGG